MRISATEVNSFIRFTCDTCEVSELYDKIFWEWNNRFTNRMGDAIYKAFPVKYKSYDLITGVSRWEKRGRIRLSTKLFNRASVEVQRETVIHEACHIVDAYLDNPYCHVTKGHGPTWQALCHKCGIKPDRYHCVPRGGLRSKVRRLDLHCRKCSRVHRATKTKITRNRNAGARLICPCGGQVYLKDEQGRFVW